MPERPKPETAGTRRGRSPTRSSPPPAPVKGPVPATPAAQRAEAAQKRDDAPPRPVETRHPNKSVNLSLRRWVYDALAAAAAKRGMEPGRYARALIEAEMQGGEEAPAASAIAPPPCKPLVSLKVYRAFVTDGRGDFYAFLNDMLERGVDASGVTP